MFTFISPGWFLILPLPWLIARYIPSARSSLHHALRVPFFNAIAHLGNTVTRKRTVNPWRHGLAYVAWFFLVVAAAGPEWLGNPVSVSRAGRDLILALDLSGSMQIPDMTLNGDTVIRLDAVKRVAKEFIQQRVSDRIGLILFGSKAYLQTPLTFDRDTVVAMIEDATVGLAGEQTAIGDALGVAIKRLKANSAARQSRVIVLLTDGGNNTGMLSPLQAAKIAESEGIRIYTIGIGSDTLLVPGPFGTQIMNPSSDLDERTLRSIADSTGGLFFRAKNTNALQTAYRELDKLEPIQSDSAVFRPITELYWWPLSVAFLLSVYLIAGRRD